MKKKKLVREDFGSREEFYEALGIRTLSDYLKCNLGPSTPDDNETPPEIFNQLHSEFGFTLDAAATEDNAKCDKFFTKENDALTQDWSGNVVFLSPPSKKDKRQFIVKAYNESLKGTTVVLLLAAATDTRYFKRYLSKGEVRFIRGRITFYRFGFKLTAPVPYGSVVCIFKPGMRPIKRIVDISNLSRPVDIEPVLLDTNVNVAQVYKDTKQVMDMRGKELPISEEGLIDHLISESDKPIGRYLAYTLDRTSEVFARLAE